MITITFNHYFEHSKMYILLTKATWKVNVCTELTHNFIVSITNILFMHLNY